MLCGHIDTPPVQCCNGFAGHCSAFQVATDVATCNLYPHSSLVTCDPIIAIQPINNSTAHMLPSPKSVCALGDGCVQHYGALSEQTKSYDAAVQLTADAITQSAVLPHAAACSSIEAAAEATTCACEAAMSDTSSGCPVGPFAGAATSMGPMGCPFVSRGHGIIGPSPDSIILDALPEIHFLPDAVMIVDAHGVIVKCNQQAGPVFGYRTEKLLGLNVAALVPDDIRPRHAQFVAHVFADMRQRAMAQRRQVRGRRIDGQLFDASIQLSPIYVRKVSRADLLSRHRAVLKPRPVATAAYGVAAALPAATAVSDTADMVSSDSSDLPVAMCDHPSNLSKYCICVIRSMEEYNAAFIARKDAQEQQQLLNNFLRLINHEVRTSTHAIGNAVEAVRAEATAIAKQLLHSSLAESPAVAEPLVTKVLPSFPLLSESVSNMCDMLNNVVDLQNLQVKNAKSQVAPFKCSDIVLALRQWWHHKAAKKQQCILIRCEIDETVKQDGEEPQLKADVVLLEKLLRVLLDNAVKYGYDNTNVLVKLRLSEYALDTPVREQPTPQLQYAEKLLDPVNGSQAGQADSPTYEQSQHQHRSPLSNCRNTDYIYANLCSLSPTANAVHTDRLSNLQRAAITNCYPADASKELSPLPYELPVSSDSETDGCNSPGPQRVSVQQNDTSPVLISSSVPAVGTQPGRASHGSTIVWPKPRRASTSAVRQVSSRNSAYVVGSCSPVTPLGLSPSAPAAPHSQPATPSLSRSHSGDSQLSSPDFPPFSPGLRLAKLTIRVKNLGQGISSECMALMGNGLFDVDRSALRRTEGGLGIGLSIAALCAKLLNGKLTVSSLHTTPAVKAVSMRSNAGNSEAAATQELSAVSSAATATSVLTSADSASNSSVPPMYRFVYRAHPGCSAESICDSCYSQIDWSTCFAFSCLMPIWTSERAILPLTAESEFVSMLSSPDRKYDRARMRILFVEDNVINIKVAMRMFSKFGFHSVTVAKNGQQAVQLVTETISGEQHLHQPFDVIISDLEMPVMDGLASGAAIRAAGITCPMIALTANNTGSVQQQCMDSGYNVFLTKPLRFESLLFTLAAIPPFQLYDLQRCPFGLFPSFEVKRQDAMLEAKV